MPVIEQLQKRLRYLNVAALGRLRLGDSVQILNERAKLQEWVSGTAQLEAATSNTIDAAIRIFMERQYLQGVRQIRLVCYGCVQALGGNAFRLIESRAPFEKLLQTVDGFNGRKRPLRKFYRGLLNGYFSYDLQSPDSNLTGRENWQALRMFLSKHLDSILTGGSLPDWLDTLGRHPNLLEDNPCRPYETAAMQGDWEVFDEIRERLEIGADSWLVREMVMAPLRAVAAMGDDAFKDNLGSILLLLDKYPLYAATGLQMLLDRYVQCKTQETNESLRDYAIGLWGNPWLPENSHQWQCCGEARAMLAHWLKRYLLGEFFTLLCNDDKTHLRRLEFWDTYSGNLTGMYLALGKDAFAVSDMSLYKFRHLAKGLVAKLTEGKPDVHACIMQFDHYHVVEFNRDTTPAYFYDTRLGTPPFYLSKGWVEIGALNVSKVTQGAEVTRLSKPMQHQDTGQLTWEGQFAQVLGAKQSVIKAFCLKYQCQYDADTQDGREWIRPGHPEQHGQEVWSVLTGWGFNYSAESGGYYR